MYFNKTLTYRYFDKKPTAFKNQPTAFKNNKKRKTNLTTDYNRLRILAGQPIAFND